MLPYLDFVMPEATLPREIASQLPIQEVTDEDLGEDQEYVLACLNEILIMRGWVPGWKRRKTTWQDRVEALRMAREDA